MKAINVRIQGSWLHRRGLRGRWATVYVHRYGGQESTERLHSHPWSFAFGVVFKGRLLEVVGEDVSPPQRRGLLSVGMYRRETLHRIEDGDAVTVFVGLLRTQARIDRAAEIRTAEGYCTTRRSCLTNKGLGRSSWRPVVRSGDIHCHSGENRIAITRNRNEL